jgi:hypothetical protein
MGKAGNAFCCAELGSIVMPPLGERSSADKGSAHMLSLVQTCGVRALGASESTLTNSESTASETEHLKFNANITAGSSQTSRTVACPLDERAEYCCKHVTPLYQGYLRAPGVPMSILTEAESTASKTKHWLLDAYITADPS